MANSVKIVDSQRDIFKTAILANFHEFVHLPALGDSFPKTGGMAITKKFVQVIMLHHIPV